jgi:uncharacterized lipoprotein YajG
MQLPFQSSSTNQSVKTFTVFVGCVLGVFLSGCATTPRPNPWTVSCDPSYQPSAGHVPQHEGKALISVEVTCDPEVTDAFKLGKTGLARWDCKFSRHPRVVMAEAVTQALILRGYRVKKDCPAVCAIHVKKFTCTIKSGAFSPFYTADVSFDIAVKDPNTGYASREIADSVTTRSPWEPVMIGVCMTVNQCLARAVDKAVDDADITAGVEKAQVAVLAETTSHPSPEITRELAIWQPSERQQAWMLAVGVGQYKKQTIPVLPYAASDTDRLRQWFSSQKHMDIAPDHLRVLCNEQASRENVLAQIDWLRKQAMPEDLVFFYFTGHGAPELASDGKSVEAKYLVLYDTDPAKLFATGLPLDELTRRLDTVKAKTQVVILEACYAGAVGQNVLKGTPTADLEIRPRFIQEMGERGGRVILSASSGRQIAIGSEEVKGGLFTHYLLKAWSEAGNKRLIADCFEQIWDNVRRAANKLGSTQEPTKYGDQNVDVILGK